jgi:hypothetical protein
MLSTLIGDIIGSVHEFSNFKGKDFTQLYHPVSQACRCDLKSSTFEVAIRNAVTFVGEKKTFAEVTRSKVTLTRIQQTVRCETW